MSIELKPRTTTVVLFHDDDLHHIEALLEVVTSAVMQTAGTSARIGDGDPRKDAAKAHDDFVTKATERAVKVELTALKKNKWRALLKDHPPRKKMVTEKNEDGVESQVEKTEPEDELNGFNVETFGDVLIPLSISPGQFDTTADRDTFIDDLDDPRYSKLYSAAVALNRGAGADPKADLSSRLDRIYGENSTSPDASG